MMLRLGSNGMMSARRRLPQLFACLPTRINTRILPSMIEVGLCNIDNANYTNSLFRAQQQRGFHGTLCAYAKAKGKKGGAAAASVPTDDTLVGLPSAKDMDPKMDAIIKKLEDELDKHRVGKVNSNVFSDINVASLGSIGSLGQVTVKSATKVSINVYDPTVVGQVVDAIKASGMGLNPGVENSTILVNVPKPSKEARETMAKLVNRSAEKAKQDIRHARKEFLDSVKKVKKSHSEDDVKRVSKEADAATEKKIALVTQAAKRKEKEILTA